MSTYKFTGVIDRFEDDLAVVLLEVYGDVVDDIVIDRSKLPADAAHPDAVLEITLTGDGEVTAIEYDPEESTDRKERAQSRFDRLAERPPEAAIR